MQKELIFLGTGEAMVTKCYNTCFLLRTKSELLLVDTGGGNGIMKQLRKAGFMIHDIKNVFITHIHTDHLLGIIWLIRSAVWEKAQKNEDIHITIYGHDEVIETIEGICRLLFQKKTLEIIRSTITLKPLQDGDTVVFQDWKMEVFDTQSTKCKQFGISITFTDERRLVYPGDEPLRPVHYLHAKKADVLIHEAFCLDEEADKFEPHKINHSTVADAAKKASELEVQKLILVHSVDYKLTKRKAAYCKEAELYFNGEVLVPYDLETINF